MVRGSAADAFIQRSNLRRLDDLRRGGLRRALRFRYALGKRARRILPSPAQRWVAAPVRFCPTDRLIRRLDQLRGLRVSVCLRPPVAVTLDMGRKELLVASPLLVFGQLDLLHRGIDALG